MKKRGLSEVIATILMIVLTLAAVMVAYAFIRPMIDKNTKQSKECFDSMDSFSINSALGYTCYKTNESATYIMVDRNKDIDISGLAFSLKGENFITYKVYNNLVSDPAGVRMYDNTDILQIPKIGESKTYIFPNINATGVDMAIIMPSGAICNKVSQILNKCD